MHVNAQKAQLRKLLADGRVVTLAQVHRWGLSRAAELMNPAQVMLSVRVRSNDRSSLRDVTFMAQYPSTLSKPTRDLTHRAALSELEQLMLSDFGGRVVLRPPLGTRGDHRRPDASLVVAGDHTGAGGGVAAVEVDLGYDHKRLKSKAIAVGTDPKKHYQSYILASTIHDRTSTVTKMIETSHQSGVHFGSLNAFVVRWVDFWSFHDPYVDRPRCHKINERVIHLNSPSESQ